MDDLLKAAIRAVKDAELAKRTAPADEAAPTPGDAMDPAAGASVSPSDPSEGGGGIGDMFSGVANAGMETIGRLVRGEADPEFAQAVTGAETELDNTQTDPNAEPGLHEKTVATMAAIPTGAVKAGYEAVDGAKSLLGVEPGPKSAERTKVEALDEALRSRTMAAGLASSLSSFTVGLIGAGKLLGPLKALAGGSKLATGAYEVAKGATAGFFALDPHEGRLSDIVQAFPSLENPVSAFLASDPEDTQIEGRLKNALEGIGMDVAAASLFAVGLKALKALRSGDKEAAQVAATELDTVAKEVEVPPPTKPVSDEDVMAAIEGRTKEAPDVAVEARPGVDVPAGTPEVPSPAVGDGPQAAPGPQGAGQSDVPIGGGASQQDIPLNVSPSAEAPKAGPAVPPIEAQPSTVKLADEDVGKIISGTKADLEVVQKAGGVAAAINNGYKLDSMTSFPWKRMITGDDVDVLVENAVREAVPQVNAMKGGDVLHDAQVVASMKEIAKTYRVDPQLLLGELAQAGEAAVDSVRRMESGHMIFRKMSLDVTAAIKKFNAGQFGEFGTEEVAREEIKRRLTLMLEVYGNTQSIISNAGRVVRRQRSEFDQLGEVLATMNKVDDRKLFKVIEDMDGNPELIKEAVKPGFWRRVMEEASFSMRNGLLWLYPTHSFNIVGNTLIAGLRPLETTVGSLFLGGKASHLRARAIKEYLYTATSTLDGFKAASKSFVEADSRLAPHSTDLVNGGEISTSLGDLRNIQPLPVKDFGDLWANAHMASSYLYRNGTGLPSRVLGMQDEFFKQVRYRAVVQSNAALEGSAQGLRGQDLKDYISNKLGAAFDENGKGIDMAALKEAQAATLNSELLPGTLGASIRNVRGQHPWLGLVLPYVKTPINALRYTHKYTPGLNALQKEYRDMFMGRMGVEEQARAVGQVSLGFLFMSAATLLVSQGKVTGGGPSDKKLRKILTDDGWRPYSIQVQNEDGTTSYVSYNRLDPIAMPFALAADCYDGYRSGGDMTTVMQACGLSVAKQFNERGFTLNIQAALEALSDPDARGVPFFGRLASGVIPASSALRGYVNQDPYMREARTLLDYTLKDMPGYSEGLPIHRDPFGDPVLRHIGISTTGTSEVVNQENDRMILESGFGVRPVNAVRDGIDLRDITLESGQNAYDRYQELVARPENGQKPLKEVLAQVIQSDTYQALLDGPPEEKSSRLYALQKVIQPYQDYAYKEMLSESKLLQNEVIKKKYTFPAQAADKANGDTSASQRLLDALTNNR